MWQRNSRGDHLRRASGPVWVFDALLKDAEMVVMVGGIESTTFISRTHSMKVVIPVGREFLVQSHINRLWTGD